MKYDRIIRYVLETPWAIRPQALAAIIEVLQTRVDGKVFSDEELADRIGAANAQRRAAKRAGNVAVLPIYGSIFPRANLFTDFSGGTSLERFQEAFRELDSSSDVASIVLDISSPGGSVELVPETAEMIRAATTPVTAIANAEAASAAYWLGAQADELVITPSGMAGSIGVWTAHEDWSRHDGNLGVDTTLIFAGQYKVEGNPFEPLGDEAKTAIQLVVDEYYDMFTAAVAAGRGVSGNVAKGEQFGQGRMLTAERAVKAGMADRVATFDTIVRELMEGRTPTGRSVATEDLPIPSAAEVRHAEDPEGATATEPAAPEQQLVAEAERLLRRPTVRDAFAPK